MDVDTLLARQMELHTSVRRPPKSAGQLSELHETMRNYHHYFAKLKALGEQLHTDTETVFQCFMYISMGGAVSFDKQHEDGSVPMHQAKVLARAGAIKLEPAVREAISVRELMVYVGLSKDLRTSLRVKVEDGNDLLTAEKSVSEALEYLDYICRLSGGDPDRMFAFYMVEEASTLERMLEEAGACSPTTTVSRGECSPTRNGASPLAASLTIGGDTASSGRDWTLSSASGGGRGATSPITQTHGGESAGASPSMVPLPSPLSPLPEALRQQATAAVDTKANAAKRVKAAQTVLDWLTAVPTDFFADHTEAILKSVGHALSALVAEKRSALCRAGCSTIALLIQRLSDEPYFAEHRDGGMLVSLLTEWTQALCKGVYVTVAAISNATDLALRELVLCSRGHVAVVKAVLSALQSGTQTELRRKCIGYLALCVVAASCAREREDGAASRSADKSTRTGENGCCVSFAALLVAPAQQYVQVGDSPSRKMARALCAILRAVCHLAVPIADPKSERLIQLEKAQVLPYLEEPRELERVLFETNNFVSSMRHGNATPSSSSIVTRAPGSRPVSSSSSNVVLGDHDAFRQLEERTRTTGPATSVDRKGVRPVLSSSSPSPSSGDNAARGEAPVDSSPLGRQYDTQPPSSSPATKHATISATPLTDAHPAPVKAANHCPVSLPPISRVGMADKDGNVFDTSVSLAAAGEEDEEESDGEEDADDAEGPDGCQVGTDTAAAAAVAGLLPPRRHPRTSPGDAPLGKDECSPPSHLESGSSSGCAGTERLLPLSLRPSVNRSPSPQHAGRGASQERGATAKAPALPPAERRRVSPSGGGGAAPSLSPREEAGKATSVPRLSDSLRRKIELHQR